MSVLVLTRRLDESIMIGDDVEITLRQIKGGQVKLAIAAPRTVRIWRTELWLERRLQRDTVGEQRRGRAGGPAD